MNPLQTVKTLKTKCNPKTKHCKSSVFCLFTLIHLSEKKERDVDTHKTLEKLIRKKRQYINSLSQESHKNRCETWFYSLPIADTKCLVTPTLLPKSNLYK